MLDCFIPGHDRIDNTIHSYAEIQLKNECNDIMTKQGVLEPIGTAKITKAYNLPSKYIIHTVGPNINTKINNKIDSKYILKSMKKIKMI